MVNVPHDVYIYHHLFVFRFSFFSNLFWHFITKFSNSDISLHLMVLTMIILQELNSYLAFSTSTSVIVDKSSDGDFLRIGFNIR